MARNTTTHWSRTGVGELDRLPPQRGRLADPTGQWSRDLFERVEWLMSCPGDEDVDRSELAHLQSDLAAAVEHAQYQAALAQSAVAHSAQSRVVESAFWGYQSARALWAYRTVVRRFGRVSITSSAAVGSEA